MPDAFALKLLVESAPALAIIGKGGLTVRRIKLQSGVHSIHLSNPRAGDRTVALVGPRDALIAAYALIAEVVRAEKGLDGQSESARLLVPDGPSLVGANALAQMQRQSGASMRAAAAEGLPTKEALVACTGTATQVTTAVHAMLDRVASRSKARHASFFEQWAFDTDVRPVPLATSLPLRTRPR